MKTMTGATLAALAFGLGLASTPVIAADYAQYRDRGQDQDATQQDQDKDGDKDRDRRDRRNRKDNTNQTAPTPPSGRSNTDYQNNNRGGNDNDRWRSNRHNADDNDRNRDRHFDGRRDRDGRDWNRDRRRPTFNINIYRRNITSPRRYRHGKYRAPRGFNYRRWHYGERLPVMFYGRNYWLLDYIAYGLFAPPAGYVWVRYGDDALLIDTYTGEIVQVRYDVFYS